MSPHHKAGAPTDGASRCRLAPAGRPRIKQATGLSCHEGDARRSVVTVPSVAHKATRAQWAKAKKAR
jgi:hypothetical protein